jgi:hypothetical protein
MPPVVFEPAILAGDRPYTRALDRSANGIGKYEIVEGNISNARIYIAFLENCQKVET